MAASARSSEGRRRSTELSRFCGISPQGEAGEAAARAEAGPQAESKGRKAGDCTAARRPGRAAGRSGRSGTQSISRGGAAPGRGRMTRRDRRRSSHFLGPPAGAARCTQRRSRELAAAAMSHQTGIQGNRARRDPQGRGSREARESPEGCRTGRAGVWPGPPEVGLAGRAGPRRLSALLLPGRSRFPGAPGLRRPPARFLLPPRCRWTRNSGERRKLAFEAAWLKGACLPPSPTLAQLSPFWSGREELGQWRRLGLPYAVESQASFPFHGPKENITGL